MVGGKTMKLNFVVHPPQSLKLDAWKVCVHNISLHDHSFETGAGAA